MNKYWNKGLALLAVLILIGVFIVLLIYAYRDVGGETSILLVQDADSGSLVDNQDGTYTLALAGVPPVIFYDGSGSYVTQISMEEFVSIWDYHEGNNFNSDPPNAALEILGADPSQDVITLEIMDAAYDAQAETLNCSVTLLEFAGGNLSEFDSRSDVLTGTPENFEDVVFFVDLAGYYRGGDIYGSVVLEDGIKVLSVIMVRFPGDIFAYVELGDRLMEKGKYAMSEEMYKKALGVDGDSYIPWCRMARLKEKVKKYSESEYYYDACISRFPTDQNVYIDYSRMLIGINKIDKAKKIINMGLKRFGTKTLRDGVQ